MIHRTGIEQDVKRGIFGRVRTTYTGQCDCGWKGEPRKTLRAAIKDNAEHIEFVALDYASDREIAESAADETRHASETRITEKEPETVNPIFEMVAVPLIGMIVSQNQAQIDHLIDDAANKAVAAVNDSATQIDDVAVKALATALERFAARVRAGVAE